MLKELYTKIFKDMKIVRESVNFERGIDPKRAMGIGEEGLKNKWGDLKKGDILRIKKQFGVNARNRIASDERPIKMYDPSESLRIHTPANVHDDGCISFTAYKVAHNYTSHDDYFIWGSPWDFEELFQKEIKESINFQRGKDPKETIGIGLFDIFVNRLEAIYPINIRLEKRSTKAQETIFCIHGFGLYGDEPWRDEVTAIFGKEYIEKLWSKSPWHFIQIKLEYSDLYAKAWEMVYGDVRKVHESINFQRGKDPKDSLDIGIRNTLQKRILGYWVKSEKKSSSIERIWKNIINDLGEEKIEDVLFLGRELDPLPFLPAIPEEIRKRLEPYVFSKEAAKSSIIYDHGTGSKYQLFETPYGKVLREYSMGFIDNYYVGFETAKTLGLYKYPINESLSFERGKDPKDALKIGSPLARLADELGMTYPEIKQNKKDLQEIVAAAIDLPHGGLDDRDYKFAFYAVADDPMAYDIQKDLRLYDVALWADAHQKEAISILRTPDIVSESVNFERGMDPKRAMGLGAVKVKGDRGVGDYTVRLIKPYQGFDCAPGEEVWEIKYLDREFEGAKGYAYKYPASHILTLRGYWGEIDAFIEGINEDVNFERGMDPIKAMDAGVSKLLKPYSLAERTEFTHRESFFITYILGIPASDIYKLGFAGEIDYDTWHFNDYTQNLEDLVHNGNITSRKEIKEAAVKAVISDTMIGRITKIIFDGEGAYYFSDIKPAASLELWKVDRNKWESVL